MRIMTRMVPSDVDLTPITGVELDNSSSLPERNSFDSHELTDCGYSGPLPALWHMRVWESVLIATSEPEMPQRRDNVRTTGTPRLLFLNQADGEAMYYIIAPLFATKRRSRARHRICWQARQ
jgi:hypothetical protein